MKTEIIKIKGDWKEVLNDCRATVSKGELDKEPSAEWKRKMMIAEHDPIRDIVIKFRWWIKYWSAMHWKTHIWRSRTNTQRNDRQQNYDRNKAPQDMIVEFIGDPNLQHLIDTWRKRLCYMADPYTREHAEDFKIVLLDHEPEASNALVPNCVYRCGCPEPASCGWYSRMVEKHPDLASTDIQTRYDAYNRIFYRGEAVMADGFIVIDNNTGKYPDVEEIVLREKWASGLVHCDVEGFAITESGTLLLVDECGCYAVCPDERFTVAKVEAGIYDQEDTFPDCTVQVLTNTATGEISVG